MLRAVRNILHGPVAEKCESVTDANSWRQLPFVLLLVALFVFGFFPKVLTEKIRPGAALIVDMANGGNQNTPVKPPAGVNVVQTTSETK